MSIPFLNMCIHFKSNGKMHLTMLTKVRAIRDENQHQ